MVKQPILPFSRLTIQPTKPMLQDPARARAFLRNIRECRASIPPSMLLLMEMPNAPPARNNSWGASPGELAALSEMSVPGVFHEWLFDLFVVYTPKHPNTIQN